MSIRFTLDGSDALEQHLAGICAQVWGGVRELVPARRLEALVLGGGYGRGEGGVLRTAAGDRPYNDLEFYLFLRGHPRLNECRYARPLAALAERLAPAAGLHLEFKIDSLERLGRSPVSMYSYDLVAGHRVLGGAADPFAHAHCHGEPGRIPLAEATRLLFNRCTGLLLVRELLNGPSLTEAQTDFVVRNLAKVRLALGDAFLAAMGQYHWSCRERHRRLQTAEWPSPPVWLAQVQAQHGAGVEFKLHPGMAPVPRAELEAEYHRLAALGLDLWLWLERRRLGQVFETVDDYALAREPKCAERPHWRNLVLTIRTFGVRAALDRQAWRYPRERLFNALTLLLWRPDLATRPAVVKHLRRQLQTAATDWTGLVAAYKSIWPSYG